MYYLPHLKCWALTMRCKAFSTVFFVLFFISFTSFGSVLDECQQSQCVAVVDAGSSGSRVHVYQIVNNDSTSQSDIIELWSHKIRPGFASLDPSASTIQSYMNALLTETPNTEIPIYFYATAGMRLIPDAAQGKYYAALNKWFDKSPNWNLIDAKTISGKEEAIYGWLSVNQQLDKDQKANHQLAGVLDMGGASVQIAFPISEDTTIDEEDLATVTLNGKEVRLFVHSFLGLGQNIFSYQFLDAKNCFSNQYPLPNGESGLGNPDVCQRSVTNLINSVHEVNLKVQPVLQQNQPEKWFAMGGVEFLINDPIFGAKTRSTTGDEIFNHAAAKTCQQSWPSLISQNPDNAFIHNFCLFSSYYYALLVNGYGINSSEPIHFLPKSKTSDWTAGVALHLS